LSTSPKPLASLTRLGKNHPLEEGQVCLKEVGTPSPGKDNGKKILNIFGRVAQSASG
jgi:hypothetical protein